MNQQTMMLRIAELTAQQDELSPRIAELRSALKPLVDEWTNVTTEKLALQERAIEVKRLPYYSGQRKQQVAKRDNVASSALTMYKQLNPEQAAQLLALLERS